MDLFGKKAKRRLDAAIAESDRRSGELLRIIRDLDQVLYNMSQCAPDWERMRPLLAGVMVSVERRRKQESDRITNLILQELEKA